MSGASRLDANSLQTQTTKLSISGAGRAEVAATEGTGIVHIAPGCGAEDFELGKLHDLPMIMPVDENGLFYAEFLSNGSLG